MMDGKTYRGWRITFEYGRYQAVHPDYDASWEGEEDGWRGNGLCCEARTLEELHEEIDEIQDERNEANGQFRVGA
jgi:hypothetical protein